jgi:hypothetical protein
MSKKTKKSSKMSKTKQKKNTIAIEDEYTGDISNFEEFASFYRQRIVQKNVEINEPKKDSRKKIKHEQVTDNLGKNKAYRNSVGYYFEENINKKFCTCDRKLPSCQCLKSLSYTTKVSKVLSLKSDENEKSKSVSNCVFGVLNKPSANHAKITSNDDRLYHEMYSTHEMINPGKYKEMIPGLKTNDPLYVDRTAMKCNSEYKKYPNDPLYVDRTALKCNSEYKKYYEIISGATNKPEKTSLEYLSELAYLDYHRTTINDTEAVRECCLGYNNCTHDECWMEHCSKCSLCQNGNKDPNKCFNCPSCKNTKLDKPNEYLLPNTSTSKTDINKKRSEKRKSPDK